MIQQMPYFGSYIHAPNHRLEISDSQRFRSIMKAPSISIRNAYAAALTIITSITILPVI